MYLVRGREGGRERESATGISVYLVRGRERERERERERAT